MTAVWSLARHAFLDAMRERVFRTLALFLLVLVGAARLVHPLALGEGRRVTLDLGLGLISLFGLLLVLLIGTRAVQKEIDRKTILVLLAQPIRRGEFLLGKFFGLLAVVGVGLAGMLVILMGALSLSGYAWDASLLVAGYYAFLELALLCALSLLLTSLCSPVLASFGVLGLYVAGHLAPSLLQMAQLLPPGPLARLVEGLFLLLPRLDLYSHTLDVVHGVPATGAALAWGTLYAGLYCTAALLVALLALRRREFS